MMWLTCSYSFVPGFLAYSFTSINEQGCCARCWRHFCVHPYLHACLRFPIFASDTASRAKIWFIQHAVKCWKHGLAIERRTSAWCNLMQGAICGNKIMAKIRRPVAWLHDKVGPWTLWKHRIAPCIRSALTCVILNVCTWCRLIWSKMIQEFCAKRARKRAKRAQKGAKRARKKKCTT